jgi:hypothetical protein
VNNHLCKPAGFWGNRVSGSAPCRQPAFVHNGHPLRNASNHAEKARLPRHSHSL